MTNNPRPLSLVRQVVFWALGHPGVALFLACQTKSGADRQGNRQGYMLLRPASDGAYITEVVAASARGKGIASQMIDHAKSLYPKLIAEIRQDNEASIHLHIRNGFSLKEMRGDVMRFEWVR